MAKLNDDWFWAFQGCFKDEEDVIEFIFERLDISDFEDSYINVGGYGEPNEMFKITANDKRDVLRDFMMDLVERSNKQMYHFMESGGINMEIKFKNGSEIKVIEAREDTVKSKPEEFQYEDMSAYRQYLKRHPSAFAELLGIKLYWWQKVYIDVVGLLYSPKNKAEKIYKKIVKKYGVE